MELKSPSLDWCGCRISAAAGNAIRSAMLTCICKSRQDSNEPVKSLFCLTQHEIGGTHTVLVHMSVVSISDPKQPLNDAE